MSELSFDVVKRVCWLLRSVVVVILLVIVVKIDEVGVVIIATLPLGAVASEMPLLTALETCTISRVAWRSLGVGNISSCSTSSSSASPVVWSTGSINVHLDWLVVHPSWCIGGIVLGLLLSLSSSLSKLLVTVPSSSSALGEEWAIWCVSSSKCRKVRRWISSISTVLRRITTLLRRDDGVE